MRDVNQAALPEHGPTRSLTRREALAASAGLMALPFMARLATGADSPSSVAPEWTSFRNGPQLLGLSSAKLSDQPKVRWTLDAPDGVVSTAAIANGKVYIAGLSGDLHCVNRTDGKILWTYKSIEKAEKNTFAPGFKASPTLTADTIYLGDEDGVFHAIDRESGRKKWTFQTDAEIISSATIEGDNVLFGSYDNTLYCLDRVTGQKRWGVETEGYVHCTPAVSEGKTFIAGCDEHLRAVDIATGEVVVDMPIGTYLIASPATREGLLYFGTYAATIVCIDWANKKTVWTYEAGRDFPFQSSAAVTEKFVVAGGRDKNVHGVDRQTGKGVWTFPTRSRVDSSPAICGERVYVGSSDRNLYCLDLTTGKELWKHNVGAAVTASPAIGEGVIVIGGEGNNAKVYCLG